MHGGSNCIPAAAGTASKRCACASTAVPCGGWGAAAEHGQGSEARPCAAATERWQLLQHGKWRLQQLLLLLLYRQYLCMHLLLPRCLPYGRVDMTHRGWPHG